VLLFSGQPGAFVTNDASPSGVYAISLPPGVYTVTDVTFDSCAIPPTVTPKTVTISGASQVINFATTGCIVF